MNATCFHCSEPLGKSALVARIGDRDESVCCAGCRAVAELIAGAGLEQYYEMRSERPARPPISGLEADAWTAYARSEIADALVVGQGDLDTVTLGVEGLRCSACAWLIDKVLSQLEGVVSATTNAATGRVHIEWQRSVLTLADVMRAIARAGYRPFPPGDSRVLDQQQSERRVGLRHLAVSGFGMMQVMMFAVAVYSAQLQGDAIEPRLLEFFRMVSMLVAAPVMFYAGLPIFSGALRSVSRRTVGMDVPVALALVLAFGASVYNVFDGNTGEVYFDSVTMFIFFVTLGRYIQMSVRNRTMSITDALARQMPSVAHRIQENSCVDVAVAALAVDDLVLVRRGEVLPADGELLEAVAQLDESLLSGESAAVRRGRGETLSGGSLNLGDPIRIKVTAIAQASVLAHVVTLLEKAQAQRPRISAAADKASTHFLSAVLIAATLTAAIWAWLDPSRAFPATLAVLVVACPCAFAIAMPAAVSAAIAHLARLGVLVTNPNALEKLAQIDHAIFDKTGTLTHGKLQMQRCIVAEGVDELQCRQIAASLEASSEHPIARALADFTPIAPVSNVRTAVGAGIEGELAQCRYRIGTPEFAAEMHNGFVRTLADPQAGSTVVVLADEHRVLAQFELQDQLRDGAPGTISALRESGIASEILSGDRQSVVDILGERCGISQRLARHSPEQKLARLQSLQQQGHRVLMLGDGINDAPVLAAADVSIAMGRGTALAHASADMILMTEDLAAVPAALQLSQRMRRIVRQNLFWSAAYNFGSLPLAALGFIPPWLAAVGMSASSVLVVLNATRLLPRRSNAAQVQIRATDIPSVIATSRAATAGLAS
ncbi:MAG: heavy metal translocating P-type ATPase [Povalibacter sp.]